MSDTGVLIAAAGMSSRMGTFKPLLPLGDETLLSFQLNKWVQLQLSPIVIVTGNHAEELEACIRSYKERIKPAGRIVCIRNPEYRTADMFSSIKLGMEWLKDRCEDFFVVPADVPLFSTETVRTLLAGAGAVRKPVCQGRSGHPLYIRSELIEELLLYKGEGGLGGALKEKKVSVTAIPVEDEGILHDADTMEDYREILGKITQ